MKKETPAKVFSRKFCEFFKNTYFAEDLRMTASVTTNHLNTNHN